MTKIIRRPKKDKVKRIERQPENGNDYRHSKEFEMGMKWEDRIYRYLRTKGLSVLHIKGSPPLLGLPGDREIATPDFMAFHPENTPVWVELKTKSSTWKDGKGNDCYPIPTYQIYKYREVREKTGLGVNIFMYAEDSKELLLGKILNMTGEQITIRKSNRKDQKAILIPKEKFSLYATLDDIEESERKEEKEDGE
jgi:hypothetical protein